MIIAEFLRAEGVLANLRVGSKKQALAELSTRAAGVTGLAANAILATLCERERLGSTGVGGGIAIPHGKFAGIALPVGLFARLDRAVDLVAIDNQAVDLIFLLLMPEGAVADHLKVLARVSRLMRDKALCDKLRGTDRSEALYLMLTEGPASHAA
jgi:PTS system nitrogen regulatory IIA component